MVTMISFVLIVATEMLLVPPYANASHDGVLYRAELEKVERVSVSSTGEQADGASSCDDLPSISQGGRYVAFTSLAGNLSPFDTNGQGLSDVFVRDRKTNETEIVSVTDTGLSVPRPPRLIGRDCSIDDRVFRNPTISDNGRFVAFASTLPLTGVDLLDPLDGAPAWQVFVRDRKRAKTELVPIPSDVYGSDNLLTAPQSGRDILQISGNGRYLIFDISSNDPGAADAQRCVQEAGLRPCTQVFLYDRRKGETVMVSPDNGEPANANISDAYISATGRFVVIETRATNLTSDPDGSLDTSCISANNVEFPSCRDVFVWERDSKKVELV